MQKREDSIRSLGHTRINVDKPLRAKLKALARSEGVPMVEYLRALVDRELRGKNIPLALGQLPGSGTSLTTLANEVQKLASEVAMSEQRHEAVLRLLAKAVKFDDVTLLEALRERLELDRAGEVVPAGQLKLNEASI